MAYLRKLSKNGTSHKPNASQWHLNVTRSTGGLYYGLRRDVERVRYDDIPTREEASIANKNR